MINVTFWELIKNHSIEIPVIQRDYAQGRLSKKSTSIRVSFIESIIKSSLELSSPLHLNFIYGKIKGGSDLKKLQNNKKAIELMLSAVKGYSDSLELDFRYDLGEIKDKEIKDPVFIPLDGQQRITTLFLFHLYLLKRVNDNQYIEKLTNFSYLIRSSSKDFCTEIIKNELIIDTNIALSETIKDSPWFFLFWCKDPTVEGMLNTLDEIHKQCRDFDNNEIDRMLRNLINIDTSKIKPISFELLDLDEFELTDKLYVKMNSRGKQLTHFENFKSWLMEYIEDNDFFIRTVDWRKKLDTTWSDLFWKYKDDKNMLIDEEFFRYIRNMMQIYFLLNNDLESSKSITKVEAEANRKKAYLLARDKNEEKEYVYLSNKEFIDFGVLTEESINTMFECLDIFSAYTTDSRIALVFKNFVTGNMELVDKVNFYILYLFLKSNSSPIDDLNLTHFFRIYNNLITNTQIDSIIILKSILLNATEDSKYFNHIYINSVNTNITFKDFKTSQIEEERLKARLITNSREVWEKTILKAESHSFFSGQIGFLFKLAGEDIERFKLYYKQANELFNEDSLKDKEYKFERALLTFGDYLYRSGKYRNGSKKTFWRMNKDRDNSWNRILSEHTEKTSNADYKKVWLTFEKMMHTLVNSNESLDNLIDSYNDNSSLAPFIKHPETFDMCGNKRHFIDNGREKYLLSKSDRGSSYSELNSFYFYISTLKDKEDSYPGFDKSYYYSCRQKDGYPCTVLKDYIIDDFNFTIEIRYYGYNTDPWEIRLFSEGKKIDKIQCEVKKMLESKYGFNYRDEVDGKKWTSGYFKLLPPTTTHIDIKTLLVNIGSSLEEFSHLLKQDKITAKA